MSNYWTAWGQRQLDNLLTSTPETPFNDTSKIIFFSDAHRSNKNDGDEFAPNEGLFTHALGHYYQAGFTYVELGDGDDLWQTPRFGDIQQAYPVVFDWLRLFKLQNRLHLIVGNHEVQGQAGQSIQKGDFLAQEGLVLRHTQTGQRLLVAHGHQVDIWCNQLNSISQWLVHFTQRTLDFLQEKRGYTFTAPTQAEGIIMQRLRLWYQGQQENLTQQLIAWARDKQQLIISGHTHWPIFPVDYRAPYFNAGCCINPGYITGIEIQNGMISLIKWFIDGTQRYQWSLLAAPQPLSLFG
jgi:UDP-2,3-diacylglucosamine pyrophosphatase LpxH